MAHPRYHNEDAPAFFINHSEQKMEEIITSGFLYFNPIILSLFLDDAFGFPA